MCDHCLSSDLLKADSFDDDGVWRPHESPFIRQLIEEWTNHGLDRHGSLQSELMYWINGHRDRGRDRKPVDTAPNIHPRWSRAELQAVKIYLENLPTNKFELYDWMLVVEYLVQRYLPEDVLIDEAEWLVSKAQMMGRANSRMDKISEAAASALVAEVSYQAGGYRAGVQLKKAQHAALRFGQIKCAEHVSNLHSSVRAKLRMAVIGWQEDEFSGTPHAEAVSSLQTKLFDDFGTFNRDWRRIALTEGGENFGQGFIASMPDGAKVRRLEMYDGACKFCRSIDGLVFTVVPPAKRDKDGAKEVWIGKSNVGRSSAARKRTPMGMVDRTASETWWVPAGTVHPHCFVDPTVPIYTTDGWKCISDIMIGDLVLTHKGRFRAVNWVLEDEIYSGEVVTLHASFDGKNRSSIPSMTPEHPVLTKRGWVPAGEINCNDSVVAVCKICPTCGKEFINIKHDHVTYCSAACHPKNGKNQFSTNDPVALEAAKQAASAGNCHRMSKLTVEQRRELTSSGRAVMKERGYSHMQTAEVRRKSALSNGTKNYTPSVSEKNIGDMLSRLGLSVSLQHPVIRNSVDSLGRPKRFFADIALPNEMICVEIDGAPWHGRLNAGRDEARDAEMSDLGWTTMRFDAAFAKSNPSAVSESVARLAMNHSGEYKFGSLTVEKVTRRNVRNRRLYNFGVDDDESYVIRGGVVVHNCRGTWIRLDIPEKDHDPEFTRVIQNILRKK